LENSGAHIDLLLTDVVMPDMSGPELASRVRGRSPATRVLFVSGYGLPGESANHLAKPFTPAQLLDKVRQTLNA
jgi:two-component system cell cycle sensor histidine kinase/response regulator CckA